LAEGVVGVATPVDDEPLRLFHGKLEGDLRPEDGEVTTSDEPGINPLAFMISTLTVML
jgi:hypothetical protein